MLRKLFLPPTVHIFKPNRGFSIDHNLSLLVSTFTYPISTLVLDRHRKSSAMKLTSAHYSIFLLSSILGLSNASDSSHLNDDTPCVARSPTTGLYFDLNAISLSPPEKKDGKKALKDAREDSWYAKGHDYPANFTINICAPVIENVTGVVGVESSRWKNVSAYYERDEKVYSIGYGRSSSQASSLLMLMLQQRTSFRAFLPWPQTRPQLYKWLTVS